MSKRKKRAKTAKSAKSAKSVVSGGGGGAGAAAGAGGVCLAYYKGLVANTACEIQGFVFGVVMILFLCVC